MTPEEARSVLEKAVKNPRFKRLIQQSEKQRANGGDTDVDLDKISEAFRVLREQGGGDLGDEHLIKDADNVIRALKGRTTPPHQTPTVPARPTTRRRGGLSVGQGVVLGLFGGLVIGAIVTNNSR